MIGSLTGLLELWCDCNRITTLPPVSPLYIVQLKPAHNIGSLFTVYFTRNIVFHFQGYWQPETADVLGRIKEPNRISAG